MLPTKKTYKIQVRTMALSADEIYLTAYTDSPDRFRIVGGLSFENDNMIFPWMSQQDLVAWFRKAADLIEEAKFE